MSARASAPAVGVTLLLFVAVGLSAAVGTAALGVADVTPDPAPTAGLSLVVDGGTLAFTHEGGDALDARTLRLVVAVGGTPLDRQPSIPFFAARGFVSGPTGPFNAAADPRWTAGERATLTPAGTNAPALRPGATVTVEVYAGELRVARLSAVA